MAMDWMSTGASMLLQITLERLDLRNSCSWFGENCSTWEPVSYLKIIFKYYVWNVLKCCNCLDNFIQRDRSGKEKFCVKVSTKICRSL